MEGKKWNLEKNKGVEVVQLLEDVEQGCWLLRGTIQLSIRANTFN